MNKPLVCLLVSLNVCTVSPTSFAVGNDASSIPSFNLVSLDNKSSILPDSEKACEKNNLIYFNRTLVNKKIIELCKFKNGEYRYKYGKIDNPEIILFSKNVTKEDVPLGGFSFIYNEYEYSVMIDNYKSTLAVYKNEDILTQIYLSDNTTGYVNKTLTDLPEKVY